MNIEEYFNLIRDKFFDAYSIAKKAREKGYDPSEDVEISYSEDMADRVEKLLITVNPLIGEIGLSKKIKEIEKNFEPLSFSTVLEIADYVSSEVYRITKNKILSIELGLRAAFTYHTLGVVAASTEGIAKIEAKKRRDGKEYIAVYYSGPVRSAGGTPTAFSVIVADFLRRKFGYFPYDPTEEEVLRVITEVYEYKRAEHLQYTPKKEEVDFVVRRLPIEVTGPATIEEEVPAYKDLPRVETNKIRGGMVLVIAEGLCQKAGKLWKNLSKIAEKYGLSEWKWLGEFEEFKGKLYSLEESDNSIIKPNWKYLSQITAGRPVIALPSQKGGFRLRYGKSRTNGHAAASIHPATSILLFNFIAFGSQISIERPGKAAAVTFSDTIEPPVVRLKNGSVIRVSSENLAKKIVKKNMLDKILFLGDILISYGDIYHNKHPLVPAGYCEEWWVQEFIVKSMERVDGFRVEFNYNKPLELQDIEGIENLSKYLKIKRERLEKLMRYPLKYKPTFKEAIKISKILDVPLHPLYTFFWKNISGEDFKKLFEYIKKEAKISYSDENFLIKIAKRIEIKYNREIKEILEEILVPHVLKNDNIVIKYPYSAALLVQLGFLEKDPVIKRDGLETVQTVSILKIRDKAGTYIGARLGRPEKAKIREMKGSPMVLFPVGKEEGGRLRNLIETSNYGKVTFDLKTYYCEKCKKLTPYTRCMYCGSKTVLLRKNGLLHQKYEINVKEYLEIAARNLGISALPKIIKGPKDLSSKNRHPERIEKGILRAKYNLFVFRDGTIRFDAIEVPITYFKPKDLVYVSIEKLRELGYDKDIYGNPLEREDQILELKPQDVILPTIGPLRKGGKIRRDGFLKSLINATKFVDELLEKFYKLPKYYNVKKPEDLLGHLIIAIAPHTSAGVVGRIIGFSRTQALLMHPMMHAGIRRNCDGDEGGIILLLDALINFSVEYLPQKTGGSMDAPLVVTLRLKGMEVDDEVQDFDTYWFYPLDFYESTLKYVPPDNVKIEKLKNRLGKDEYTNWGFLHDIDSISKVGNKVSAYKTLKTMLDKLKYQLTIGEIVKASDISVVAKLVINHHFAMDVKGNLRKFSQQEFRCTKCNAKYRRIPLSGRCEKCGGRLTFTVHYGTVTKYLEPSILLASKVNLDKYTVSVLESLKNKVNMTFGAIKKVSNKNIADFLFNNKK
ncbi:MAG: hypothetical protein BXU00_01785 [Candidatus Nanoclepta minutus]|uniref:DNA polymerase II large subunit n=1 Tax=Candidatus Nanoclepta minutus TaxID=1940235 RepID=A0A397WS43_9ARCH|nr:MAG: hypothetical protein BXU00_01785 [Candidatus Nanoclepta minutus]